ncbi:acyltransferase family protein [Rahnella victoriana]|uniref:acyltransferase family protein n=1 Tax=Rahnella victoriana TaxID=1510570 RepID=UPI001E2CB127|nr:acyltransferase [Rahnella victoriana]UHM90424.1 acyltransferase [Rahnella victoriana]
MEKLTPNQSLSLESLRGVSALSVVVAHFYQLFLARYDASLYKYFALVAQSSVMIFFVMSGFLIGKSIQNNFQKNVYFSLPDYASSRFYRIYPPLIASIVITFCLYQLAFHLFQSGGATFSNPDLWLKGRSLSFYPSHMIGVMTFTNGILNSPFSFNAPLWSLPFEAWYYVIAGLIFTRKPILIAIAIMIFVFICSIKHEFFTYSKVWFFGLALSYAKINFNYSKPIAFILLAIVGVHVYKHAVNFISHGENIETYNMYFGLFFGLFLYLVILCKDVKINILPKSSKYSYSLYIIHFPIMLFSIGCFENEVLNNSPFAMWYGIFVSLCAVLIAKLLSRYIEDPAFLRKYM